MLEEKERCIVCARKIGLTAVVCKCGRKFCKYHQNAEDHNCTFDYKAHARDLLRSQNPIVTSKSQK